MAHITIPDVAPRVSYTVTTADSSFAVPFPFFDEDDLKVYVDGVLQTLTTDYTVTPTAGTEGGYVGGTVDLVVAAEDTSVVIIRDQVVERTSDFPNSGPFNIQTLNTTFDKLVGMLQRFSDRITRTIRIPDEDATGTSLELPVAATRAGKFLKFDADGDVAVAETAIGGLSVQSSTSHNLTAGTKVFTMEEEAEFPEGGFVLIIDLDNPTTKQMTGQVTDRTDDQLTVVVGSSDILGSGSGLTNWLIVVSGARGGTGATGAAGANGVDGTDAAWVIDATVRSGSFNAVAGQAHMFDTSGGAGTATIPASLAVGDMLGFIDYAGTWGTNNLTLSRNGHKFGGVAADYTCNVSSVNRFFVYTGATYGLVRI